jgi:hypothetical protein
MIVMRRLRAVRALAELLGVLAITGTMTLLAMAATSTNDECDAASVTYTNIPLSTKTQPGLIPAFNPALGTLLEVDFAATGTTSAQFLVVTQPAPPSFNYDENISFPFIGGAGTKGFATLVTGTGSIPTGAMSVFLNVHFNVSLTETSATTLARYYGTGNLNVQISSVTSNTTSGVTLTSVGIDSAEGIGAVTYIYTAVPEPSTSTLAVIGLVMLAAARKRLARPRGR